MVVRMWDRPWTAVMSRLFTEEKSRTTARRVGRSESSGESDGRGSHQRRAFQTLALWNGDKNANLGMAYRGALFFYFRSPPRIPDNVGL